MKHFIKKTINIIKGDTPYKETAKEPDLTTALEAMRTENEKAEKQYGKSFFPDEKKVKKRPEN